jgi:hypothetical protein
MHRVVYQRADTRMRTPPNRMRFWAGVVSTLSMMIAAILAGSPNGGLVASLSIPN